jgi:DNA-binding response OmpR family regulator
MSAPKKSVLVIDDNADAADGLAALVRLMGHTAAVAYDADTGLILAHANTPDVIFHDIGLPDVNGYDAAKRIREQEQFDHTLLVARRTARQKTASTRRTRVLTCTCVSRSPSKRLKKS